MLPLLRTRSSTQTLLFWGRLIAKIAFGNYLTQFLLCPQPQLSLSLPTAQPITPSLQQQEISWEQEEIHRLDQPNLRVYSQRHKSQ